MAQGLGRIRVLLVHDEPKSVDILPPLLNSSDSVRVVGTARTGDEALGVIARTGAEVVIVDMESRSFDPLHTLTDIMLKNPRPVLLLCSECDARSPKSIRALELGALDVAPKPTGIEGLDLVRDAIAGKVQAISAAQVLKRNLSDIIGVLSKKESDFRMDDTPPAAALAQTAAATAVRPSKLARKFKTRAVGFGISTGGPQALQYVLPRFPKDFPVPILIVQHIVPGFVNLLAERLDQVCQLQVKVAKDRDPLEPGTAVFAPDGRHLTVDMPPDGKPMIRLRLRPVNVVLRPCADMLFSSMANAFGGDSMAVIMTGMGSDGAEGMELIKSKGGLTIAQDEATCAVFGMPRSAIERGIVDQVVPLDAIVDQVIEMMV